MLPLEEWEDFARARAAGTSSPLYQAVLDWLAAERGRGAGGPAPLV
jgi:hypothetical protein